jgi:hypothetical protein
METGEKSTERIPFDQVLDSLDIPCVHGRRDTDGFLVLPSEEDEDWGEY